MQHMVQTQQQHQEPPQQYRIGDPSNMRGRRVFQEVDLNLICVGFYSFQYKLGYLCVFPCAPRFKLRGGRVLFIARGAHWGPAKYEGVTRVAGSWVFVYFSVYPLFSITGWPCPVHCPRRKLGTRRIQGGNACCWVLGLCVFFSLVAVCPL